MSSSIFGAERRSSEPLSALAVLLALGKKHPRPCFSQKSTRQRNQRDNDRETGLSIRDLLITRYPGFPAGAARIGSITPLGLRQAHRLGVASH